MYKHVQLAVCAEVAVGEGADRAGVVQIGQAVGDLLAARGRGDPSARVGGPGGVAGEEVHGGPAPGQRGGGGVTDPGGGAGDDHGLPLERGGGTGGELGQEPGTDPQPDPGEAVGDTRLQRGVRRLGGPDHGCGAWWVTQGAARAWARPAAARWPTARKPGRSRVSSRASGPRSRTSAW